MAGPAAVCYTDVSSKKTEMEEKIMKDMMKGIALGILLVAAVVVGQMALTGVVGFHTAELAGGTALTFLLFYTLFQSCRKRREAKAKERA